MATDYCWHCGASLAPDANFCSECGEPVTRPGDAPEGETEDAASPDTVGERPAQGTEKDTTFAALTHVLALLTWVVGPLIVLLATDDPFVDENARNALNWQIVFSIYMLVSIMLVFVFVGFVLLFLLPIVDLIVCIVAAIKANEGEAWKYPATPDIV